MINPELTAAIEKFATLMKDVPDTDLEIPWQWKGHAEGARFAFFVTLLELRQLAVKLAFERSASKKTPVLTPAQLILAQYHSAYMDLQAVIFGLSAKNSALAPDKKEWPVRTIVAHILDADINFSAVVRYSLENHRAGKWKPNPIPKKEYPRLTGLSEKEFDSLMNAALPKLLAYHRKLHPKILHELSGITTDELAYPAAFWEETRFHIGYRLHRFEAHMRQHTIQIEKTLVAIGSLPNEAKRLIRMLYSGLAEVNGNLISTDDKKNPESIELARTIESRVKDLGKILIK
jgi:hypothetical protein